MIRIPVSIPLIFLLCITCVNSCNQKSELQKNSSTISTELPWSQRMAETIIHDFPELWRTEEADEIKWTYTKGLVSDAFIALWKKTDEKRYFDYAKA